MARSSGALVLRLLRSPTERVLRAVLRLLPPRVQRLTRDTMQPLLQRWPLLSRLLAVTGKSGELRPSAASIDVVAQGDEAPPSRLRVHLAPNAVQIEPPPDPRSTAELIRLLRDPSAEVAMVAADALGGRGADGDVVLSALTEVLENPEGFFNSATRAAAIRSLGALLPKSRGARIAITVADADAAVSVAAIAALVERGDADGAEVLLKVVENAAGYYLPLTRAVAARGLGRLGVTEDPRVQALARFESDPDVLAALAALS